jgi:RNA polymerase sigma-70 factor (ECF subfamily)
LDDREIDGLIQQAAAGDSSAWTTLVNRYRPMLRNMLILRMDGRLAGRVDPSDIIQDASLAAVQRIGEYSARPDVPFYIWLRQLTLQKFVDTVRRHVATLARDIQRDVSLDEGPESSSSSSAIIAAHLIDRFPTPANAAVKLETTHRLRETLEQLGPLDREILALRHFEQLSNSDAARVCGLSESACSKRYARAIVRLRDALVAAGISLP